MNQEGEGASTVDAQSQPLNLDIVARAPQGLQALGSRLSLQASVNQTFMEPVDGVQGPFDSYQDFRNRALKPVERPVRIYAIAGHDTQIVLREDYAAVLDEVRKLHLSVEQAVPKEAGGPDEVEEAKARLTAHEHRNRVLPEELIPLLDEVPDSRYFSRGIILSDANPEDVWTRQEMGSSDFVSAMGTEPNGDLLLFRTERNEFFRVNIFHEWTHRLQKHSPEAFAAFIDAIELSWRNYVPRTYALRSYGEHWAVIGEELLHLQAERFLKVANNASVRTAVWMVALESAINAAPESRRSVYHAGFAARARYARETVLPQAREALSGLRKEGNQEAQERVDRVLAFLDSRWPVATAAKSPY